jgi:hypothetical protein
MLQAQTSDRRVFWMILIALSAIAGLVGWNVL